MIPIRKPEVKAIVSVDGKRVDFVSLKICQEMSQHQDFELVLDHKTIDGKFYDSSEKKLKLVYTKVIIDLQHGDDSGKAYVFSGIITNVRIIATNGSHGGILLLGKSCTIELERNEMMQSFSSISLANIIREITKGTMNLSCDIEPDWKSKIAFALQSRESDWSFLRRICHQYQEKFYYTGLDLVVGSHPEFPVVNLTYDMELQSLEMCSQLLPNQYSEYYYQRETHDTLSQNSPGSIEGASYTLQQINSIADHLTSNRKPNVPVSGSVPDMGSLIELSKRRKVATGGQMLYVKGIAKTCDVRIGRLVQIKMPPNMGGSEIGLYRVYKISHVLDETGLYFCEFEAMPSDLKYIPTPDIPAPIPFPIEVEILENDTDPEGMGRVKVQFPFDDRPCDTLIPVMSFDAGSDAKGSGNVKVNRGITWLPEVGDSALLYFLDGQQLSQPFIMGSMFHGKNSDNQGGGKNNYIKTIITKSGHTIKLDDTDGKEKIQVYDKNGNIIEIDTKDNTINISANETINLNAVNINLLAKNAITATAGVTFAASAGATSSVTGGISTFINAGKEASIKAGKTLSAKGGKNTLISSGLNAQMTLDSKGNTTIKGKKKVDVSSKNKVLITGTKQTQITGQKTKVQGKSKMDIKGSKVHVG